MGQDSRDDVEIRRRLAEIAGWEWQWSTFNPSIGWADADGRMALDTDSPLDFNDVMAACEAVGYEKLEIRKCNRYPGIVFWARVVLPASWSSDVADTDVEAVAKALIAAIPEHDAREAGDGT